MPRQNAEAEQHRRLPLTLRLVTGVMIPGLLNASAAFFIAAGKIWPGSDDPDIGMSPAILIVIAMGVSLVPCVLINLMVSLISWRRLLPLLATSLIVAGLCLIPLLLSQVEITTSS